MRVLVLGAYGLIGLETARAVLKARHNVTGLARSAATGRSLLPAADWISADLSDLCQPEAWGPHLEGIDAVVNAAGALQTGARDNVRGTQQDAMCALFDACQTHGIRRVVQISAVGVSKDAETEFMRTKAVADEALTRTELKWVILKPGLVISHAAYGGTALLRTLAAFPVFQPMVMADAKVQTVHVSDVAEAVVQSLSDDSLLNQSFDLVEPKSQSLEQLVLQFRTWLGFSKPFKTLHLPAALGLAAAKLADFAGWLGWRSPLRSTALKVLSTSVHGNPEPWRQATGKTLKSLSETLAELPSTRQERQFARLQLVSPILLLTLSAFWLASGIIGIVSSASATALISGQLGGSIARALVHGGAILDILIGLALLVRKTFKLACVGALTVSAAYLVSGTFLTPELWLDPLGPLVKILPGMGLTLALLLQGNER